MTTITITDPAKAAEAGAWCKDNLTNKSWDLQVRNLFSKHVIYDFSFKQPKRATEFALRWV